MPTGEPRVRAPIALLRLVVGIALAAGVVAAGLAAFGMRLGHPALWSDALAYAIPKYGLVAQRIGEGALPLWNPFEFGGMPLLASLQPAALYPPVWILYGALPAPVAHDAFFGLHLLLGAGGAFVLARQLGAGAFTTGLATLWVLCPGSLARLYPMPMLLSGLAWVPIIVVLARRAVLRPSLRGAGWLALAFSLQVFSGYPPFAIGTAYVCLFGLPFWIAEARGAPGFAWTRVALALIAAAGVAALISALQVLPTAELLPATEREQASDTLARLLAIARSPGRESLRVMGVPPLLWSAGPRDLLVGYGPVLVAAIGLGVVLRGQSASTRAVQTLAAISCLVPLGCFKVLPFYDFVRFGFEWAYMSPFFLYMAAALGIEAARRRFALGAPAVAALVGVTGLATVVTSAVDMRALKLWQLEAPAPPALPDGLRAACALGPGEGRLFWPDGQAQGVTLAERLPSIGGYEPALGLARVREVQRALALPAGGGSRKWYAGLATHPRVAARMGLECVVTPNRAKRLEAAGYARVIGAADGPGVRVYRSPSRVPRVRLVGESVTAGSPEAARGLLLGEAIDPRTTVILERAPEPSPPCTPAPDDHARVLDARAETLRIGVQTACPAQLVLTDTFAPGWTAEVDGRVRRIDAADYLFRSVRVMPGEREVVFRYRPRSVRLGFALCVVGLLAAGTLLGVPRRVDPLRGPIGRGSG